MSFLSVLKKIETEIEKGLGLASPFLPLIASVVPGGALITTIFNGVIMAETLITQPGAGAQKKALVTSLINQLHPGINPAVLSPAIDGVVALLNDLSAATAAVPATPAPIVMKSSAITQ